MGKTIMLLFLRATILSWTILAIIFALWLFTKAVERGHVQVDEHAVVFVLVLIVTCVTIAASGWRFMRFMDKQVEKFVEVVDDEGEE